MPAKIEEVAQPRHMLSPERKKELEDGIAAALTYYESAFEKKLSDVQVLGILKTVIDEDKKRLFLKKIGAISEADVLYLAEKLGVNLEAIGHEDVTETPASKPAGKGKSGSKPDPETAEGKV